MTTKTTTYTISYTDGRGNRECECEDEAREIIDAAYPDAEYGDWEGNGYQGEAGDRMLVWADADDAEGDDGTDAVAEIIRV